MERSTDKNAIFLGMALVFIGILSSVWVLNKADLKLFLEGTTQTPSDASVNALVLSACLPAVAGTICGMFVILLGAWALRADSNRRWRDNEKQRLERQWVNRFSRCQDEHLSLLSRYLQSHSVINKNKETPCPEADLGMKSAVRSWGDRLHPCSHSVSLADDVVQICEAFQQLYAIPTSTAITLGSVVLPSRIAALVLRTIQESLLASIDSRPNSIRITADCDGRDIRVSLASTGGSRPKFTTTSNLQALILRLRGYGGRLECGASPETINIIAFSLPLSVDAAQSSDSLHTTGVPLRTAAVLIAVVLLSVFSFAIFHQNPADNVPHVESTAENLILPELNSLLCRIELYSRLGQGSLPGYTAHRSDIQTFLHNAPAVYNTTLTAKIPANPALHFSSLVFDDQNELADVSSVIDLLQYRVLYEKNDQHIFVLGAFGDGRSQQFPCGTGDAVLVVMDEKNHVKYTAHWSRRSPVADTVSPVVLTTPEEASHLFNCASVTQTKRMNICWTGDAAALVSADARQSEQARKNLRLAGWSPFSTQSTLVALYP